MNPIWLLVLSNLKKKKIQNGMIAVIIMLATLLLSTAFIVMSNSGNMFSQVHNKVNGSHQILTFENGLHNPVEVQAWWEKQHGVTSSELQHYKPLSTFTHNDNEISNITLYMMDTITAPAKVDQLIFAAGKEMNVPKKGTIWIPTSLAYSKNISIGDEIGFIADGGSFALSVSGIVVDVPYSQPFTITSRIWLNPADYAENISLTKEKEMAMMGLRFAAMSEEQAYWTKFEQEFGTPYLETLTDFSGISSFYFVTNQVISFVMTFFAVVMILIALYTIGFTISDAILSNYKTIGIIKASGLSSVKMVLVYVIQYLFLTIIAVIPGLILSYFFSRTIISMSVSYLKTNHFELTIDFLNIAILIGCFVTVLVTFISFIFAWKARSIQPAQAIRYGMSEKDNHKKVNRFNATRNKWISFERLPVTLMISLRGILKDMRGAALQVIMTTLTTAVLVFGFLFIYSISSIQQTTSQWGYDDADISIDILDPSVLPVDELKESLQQDERTQHMASIGGMYGVMGNDQHTSSDGVSTVGVQILTMDGQLDEIGYINLEGHNPKSENEISIGVNVAKSLQKGVGDPIDVYMQGKKGTFTISGIYQTIANMSNSARVSVDALQHLGIESQQGQTLFMLNLEQGVPSEDFIQELKGKYGEAVMIADQKTLIKETFTQAVTILIVPISIMGLICLFVTFGITYSLSMINIKKERKLYGIYQSLGLRSNKIRFSIVSSSILLSAVGSVIGLFIGIYLLPSLLNKVLVNFGIVEFPLIIDWILVLAIVPIGILAVGAGAWGASRVIKQRAVLTFT